MLCKYKLHAVLYETNFKFVIELKTFILRLYLIKNKKLQAIFMFHDLDLSMFCM